uniref:AAA family ATPase n=1 Tax=Lactococcus garvieae TaxID=1363 RepID=UPI00254D6DB2
IQESRNIDEDLRNVYELITNQLADNIFVYSNRMSGLINTNMDFPIPLYFYYEFANQKKAFGVFPLPTESSAQLSSKELDVAKHVLEQINVVIPKIIPKLSINIKELSKQLDDDGKELHVVEVVSERDGRIIPFRCESDGIKKIVSILSALINAYSSPRAIVAIDELDSGIYEFLLGELLEVFSRGARGQIIFTSHNLRPLEILNKENIIFTTVNPTNRYIRKMDIKPSNNLRDVYLRDIQVIKGEDSLYKPTNTFEIQKAFRKAKKMNFNNESHIKGDL